MPLGLGAREDRLPQPTESAALTPLRPRQLQLTSFKIHFQLGAPSQGCIIPRPRGSVPAACIPFIFRSLACFVGGAPRAASSPGRSGQAQWRVSPLRLFLAMHSPIMLDYLCLSTATFLLHVDHLHVKGGVPEHRDSGLLLALQPSPSGFVHGIATWHTSDG